MITWIVAVYLLIGSIWLAECLRISPELDIVFHVDAVARVMSWVTITVFWPAVVIYSAWVLIREERKREILEEISGCAESVLSDIRDCRAEFEADCKRRYGKEGEQ